MRRVVAVASSGGRDSTALLHCTLRAAPGLGIEVLALHVHHGLQEQAGAWHDHVRRQARRWGADFASRHLEGQPARGESIEAWARQARYRALTEMANAAGCRLVLLAHHRRDQAETWLLQALRGGTMAGLSAMPKSIERGGIIWARPWLEQPRESIEAYVRRHRLAHIDDDSNNDTRHDRNRLRLRVWPALSLAFPEVETALRQAAREAQHAMALGREALVIDLPTVVADGALDVSAWALLPPARGRNALGGWLAQAIGRGAPASLRERLNVELRLVHAARWQAPGFELRLHRGWLSAVPLQAASLPAPRDVQTLNLSLPGAHRLPSWRGRFEVEPARDCGVLASTLREVQVRPRSGGERLSLATRGTPRSLKKQFQANGVPAWQRDGPLLFLPDDALLFVPGLGIDARAWAAAGEHQLRLRWVADDGTGG